MVFGMFFSLFFPFSFLDAWAHSFWCKPTINTKKCNRISVLKYELMNTPLLRAPVMSNYLTLSHAHYQALLLLHITTDYISLVRDNFWRTKKTNDNRDNQ
jgi:hypothetical protein